MPDPPEVLFRSRSETSCSLFINNEGVCVTRRASLAKPLMLKMLGVPTASQSFYLYNDESGI